MGNPPTWDTVKRLFSGADIGFMKMYGYNLDSFEFVSRNVDAILARIEDGSMPPGPQFEPWPQEKIQVLRDWRAAGFPRSVTPDAEQTRFIQVSEFLTGFDDLHEDPELAVWYLQRLKTRPKTGPDGSDYGGLDQAAFSTLMAGFDPQDTATFEKTVLTQPGCEAAARTVITLWYTAAFAAGPEATGTPADNRYVSGLMWRAFHAHPGGYSTEGWYDHTAQRYSLRGEPYWKYAPQADGRNTGLGPDSVTP